MACHWYIFNIFTDIDSDAASSAFIPLLVIVMVYTGSCSY
ncbi:hypothetical protein EGR_10864 [Echinococcus granulosus]|uniref:Uncharacterized protein n=1 Tax=Echinococcus granulosus TaxID=6210 RepID=W6U7C6_ECHGR|nr:hypothetical protein EGR_10864 [Echinococcus granulosus]EUB54272.1 hypothetical protein EGR_10864 [Echinococcus granulosus]